MGYHWVFIQTLCFVEEWKSFSSDIARLSAETPVFRALAASADHQEDAIVPLICR